MMIRNQPELIMLHHANVGNLEFLGKNTTIPQFAIVVVGLYSLIRWGRENRYCKKQNCSMTTLKVKERINVSDCRLTISAG